MLWIYELTDIFQGPIIQEVRQEWSPWLYQVTSSAHSVWLESLYCVHDVLIIDVCTHLSSEYQSVQGRTRGRIYVHSGTYSIPVSADVSNPAVHYYFCYHYIITMYYIILCHS